jgi:hypothetical protein
MIKRTIAIVTIIIFWTSSFVLAQKSDTRELSSFNRISVGEAIDVYLIQGSSESVRIEVSGMDIEEVLTEVKGDRLKVHLERGNYKNIDVEVWVTYKTIEEIDMSSASSVITQGVLKSNSLKIDASSAADGDLEIDVESLDVTVASSADLEVSGKASMQDVNVSSAGKYDGYDLDCEEAEVSASSAGSARVMASKKIDANASSAGSIRYKGNPDKVYEDESSGGSVSGSN